MADAAEALPTAGPLAGFLGHSMATDIVIREAEIRGDVPAVVAISMYSDAVAAEAPRRVSILSGAQETRLRTVTMEASMPRPKRT